MELDSRTPRVLPVQFTSFTPLPGSQRDVRAHSDLNRFSIDKLFSDLGTEEKNMKDMKTRLAPYCLTNQNFWRPAPLGRLLVI